MEMIIWKLHPVDRSLHSIGYNRVTWPHTAAGESGKVSIFNWAHGYSEKNQSSVNKEER